MKRWKWKKILLLTGSILLVAACIGYWAMNLAVNKMLNAISPDSIAMTVKDDQSRVPAESASASPTPANETKGLENTTQPVQSTAKEEVQPISTQPNNTPANQPGSVSVSPAPPTEPPGKAYSGEIDSTKAEQAQDNISLKDKMLVTSIFMKRFSSKELDVFMKLAGGGLTLDEKKEAKKIVMEKLSEEEYDELIEIAAKLGLSQGKKYEESKKDIGTNG